MQVHAGRNRHHGSALPKHTTKSTKNWNLSLRTIHQDTFVHTQTQGTVLSRTVGSGVEDDESCGPPEPVEGRRDQREQPHAPGQRDEGDDGARH